MRISHLKVATVVVAAALAGALLVDPAAYAMDAPVRVELTGVSNFAMSKTMRAECTGGTVVFGVGGSVNGGGGNVILTGIVPDTNLVGVTVTGLAISRQLLSWSLTAVVVCHAPEGKAPVRRSGSGSAGNASMDCIGGKILYGAGFEILNATGAGLVDRVVPRSDLSGVDVHARGTAPAAGDLVAYGVCALPLPRGERTDVPSAYDTTTPKTGTAPKPWITADGGSWVFAAGALITGGGSVHIDALMPTAALDGGYARATRVPLAFPRKSTAKRVAVMVGTDDYSLTTYGDTIGSWY